jgi:hypothetical protein
MTHFENSHNYVYSWPVRAPAKIYHDAWGSRPITEHPRFRYLGTSRLQGHNGHGVYSGFRRDDRRGRNAFKYGGPTANELVGYAALYRSS